MYIIYTGYRS